MLGEVFCWGVTERGKNRFLMGKSFQVFARYILEPKSRGGGSRCLRDLAKWTKILRHGKSRRGGRSMQQLRGGA